MVVMSKMCCQASQHNSIQLEETPWQRTQNNTAAYFAFTKPHGTVGAPGIGAATAKGGGRVTTAVAKVIRAQPPGDVSISLQALPMEGAAIERSKEKQGETAVKVC